METMNGMTSLHVLRRWWCWGLERETDVNNVTNVDDTRGCGKSRVQQNWLRVQYLILVFLAGRSNIVNWLAHENLWHATYPYRCTPASLIFCFLILNSTISGKYIISWSVSLSPYQNYKWTPSTAYSESSINPKSTVSSIQPVSDLKSPNHHH